VAVLDAHLAGRETYDTDLFELANSLADGRLAEPSAGRYLRDGDTIGNSALGTPELNKGYENPSGGQGKAGPDVGNEGRRQVYLGIKRCGAFCVGLGMARYVHQARQAPLVALG